MKPEVDIEPIGIEPEVGDRLEFTVYGLAAPGGSKTAGVSRGGRTFVRESSRRTAPWRAQVAAAAGSAMRGRELFTVPLSLSVVFYVPRPKAHYGARGLRPSAPAYPATRPDVTKLLRALEDACTGIVWRDDALIVDQTARKRYADPGSSSLLEDDGAAGSARAWVVVEVIRD